jgi:hypothetical protein
VLVHRVFGVKEAFDTGNGERYLDPFFCGSVLERARLYSIVKKPVVYEIQSFIGRFYEVVHL